MKKVLKATKIFKSSKKEAKPNTFSGLTNQRLSTASQNSTWDINSTFLCTSLGYKIDLTVESVDKRFTKLHKACWIGNEDKVKKHIKKIDVNSRDNENRLPLHLATAQGHKSIVEYLIAHKALIDVIDGDGRTPLMKAVECYHAHIVEFLLACGANGNLSDKYGDTSLHLAVRTGQPEVAFTLLKQRVDVNARNAEGWTPLHMATAQKQQNVVKYLLEMGALINSADEEGKTPLMLACKAENAPLVSLLLRSGANMEMQDNQGWTALDFTALTHKSELIDMLTQNLKTAEESEKESDPECGTHDQDTWNDNDSINEYLNLEKNEPEITIKEALPSPILSSSHEHEAPTETDCLEPKERKHGSAVEQRKLDFLKEFGLSDPSEISTPEISSISDLREKQDNARSQNMHDDTDIDQDLSTVDEVSQHQGGGRISEEIDTEKDNLISVPCLIDKDKLQPQSEVTKSFLKSDWMIAAHSSSESESEVEDIVSPSYIPSASVVRRRSSTHTDVSQTACSPDVSPTKPPLSCLTTYHTSHPEQSPISCSPSHPISPFIKNSVVDSPESPPSKHSYKNDHFSESPRTKTFGSTLSAEISPKDLMMKEDPALVDPLDVLTDSEWDSEDSAYSNEENIVNKSMNKEENVLEKARDKKTKNMGDSTKIQDFYSEQPKETSCPESVEGTLGRPDTLQGSEEMWEKNAIVNVKDVKDTNESERQSSHPRKTPPKPPPRKTRRVTDEKLPFDVESSLTLTTSPEVEENQQITKLLQGDFDSTTDNEDSITEDSPVPKIPEISPETLRTASGFQQIQEILRKQYFISVKERHDKNNLKSRLNTLKCERSTLQSKLQAEKASHNGLHKKILTLEKELLELNYRIEREKNSRMDAESLLKTVQNQLTSTLVAYNSDTEAKAVLQKQLDSLEKDVKTYKTTIKDLKDEIMNWKTKLEEEQIKPSKPLSPSQVKNTCDEEELVRYATQMKILEHQNEQYEGENTSLKAQLKILQKELEDKEAEWIERIKAITVEREHLENKCEILQKETAVVHESLDSVSYRYTSNYATLAEEKEKVENRLAEELKDKEEKEKELNESKARLKRLEQELTEVKEQLQSTRHNLTEQTEKFQKIKAEQHAEKENLLADNSNLRKQLSEATQSIQELKTHLEKNEQDSSLMNMNMHSELDKIQIMLKEKINQSEKLEKEIEEERRKCVSIEIESRHVTEENKQLYEKVNNLEDKLLSQQQEMATLRVQYEDAKIKAVAEKNTNISSEKCTLDSLLASLRSEHEKFRSMLEEQIESLKSTVENLREESKVKDSKLWELEKELRQTHREISDYQRELSKLDCTKEISKKTIEEHYLEQSRLRTEISKLYEDLQDTKQKYGLAETEVKTLQKQLNEAYSMNKNNASKPVLEKEFAEVLQRLHKSETHRKNLEVIVQKNNKKIEDLGSTLENISQKKVELENTIKDLEKKNEDLEKRLFEAKLTYSVYSREAEESRQLWQHETKTISHLGIRLSEVEKQKKDLEATVIDCQKKVSKALQVKKIAELRLQQEQDRIQQLKEDTINYKAHLKRAKQKIEDFEKFPAEVRLLTQEREFAQKKEKLLESISDQRRQIEKLEEQLNKEEELRHQAEEVSHKLSAELVSLHGGDPSQIHQLRAELLNGGGFKGNLLFPKCLSESWRPEAHQDHLTKLLNNINTELHKQSITRDIMEKDRAMSEASIRQDFLRNKNSYMEQISYLQKKLSTKETERGDLEQNLDRLKRKLEAEQLARKGLETQIYATGGSSMVRQLNNLPADSKILNNFRNSTVSDNQESVVRRNSQLTQVSTPISDLPVNSLPVWLSSPIRKHQQERLGTGLSLSVESIYPPPLSYHFQAELDRIFKKKLASDPLIDIAIPASISHETKSLDSASDKTASDYLETLQRKYCV